MTSSDAIASAGTTIISPGGAPLATTSASNAPQIIIAASDSSAADKARADYVATGKADDVVIQGALDAMPSTGGTVVLLPGHYSIADTISPNSNDTLEGYGAVLQPDLTSIQPDPTTKIVTIVNINKPGSNHISLMGFTIDGQNNALTVGGYPIAGICLSDLNVGANSITAKDLTVQYLSDEGIYNETYNDGNPNHQAANFYIENCWANYNATFFGEGGFAPGADDVTVVGGGAIGNGSPTHFAAGCAFAGGRRLHMTGFTAKNNNNAGIELLKDSNNNIFSMDCYVDATVYDDQAMPTQTTDFLNASGSASNVFINETRATVSPGQTLIVSSGQTSNGTNVESGAELIVLSGGTANVTAVQSGGEEYLAVSGVERFAVVSSGSDEVVYGSAVGTILLGGMQEDFTFAGGTVVSSGGEQIVSDTGVANDTVISAGGEEYIAVAGVDSGATISLGGEQNVFGSALGAVLSGGLQEVHTLASGTVVLSGGREIVSASGVASGNKIASGGLEYVATSGVDSGATISLGGEQNVFGSALGAVLSGGLQEVHTVASSMVVLSGGREIVSATGLAIGGQIGSGGLEYVATSGVDSGVTISLGGEQNVFGSALGAVLSGGSQEVHTLASGTVVLSGGRETVSASGVAGDSQIASGGREMVFGTEKSATISGGLLDIGRDGTASAVTFAGGGTLLLDDATTFGGRISGFAIPDQIDLANIAFTSATALTWTQGTGSGTLQVTDGTNTAKLTLVGTYSSGQFNLASDGASGTLVTDPPNPTAVAGGFDFTDIGSVGVASNTDAPVLDMPPTPSAIGAGSLDLALQDAPSPPLTGSGTGIG